MCIYACVNTFWALLSLSLTLTYMRVCGGRDAKNKHQHFHPTSRIYAARMRVYSIQNKVACSAHSHFVRTRIVRDRCMRECVWCGVQHEQARVRSACARVRCARIMMGAYRFGAAKPASACWWWCDVRLVINKYRNARRRVLSLFRVARARLCVCVCFLSVCSRVCDFS